MNARRIAHRLKSRLIAWLGAALPILALAGGCHAQSVLAYHGDAARSGNFVMPALTWDKARALRLDAGFAPSFPGHLFSSSSRSIGTRRGRRRAC